MLHNRLGISDNDRHTLSRIKIWCLSTKIILTHFTQKPKLHTTWTVMWLGLGSLFIWPALGLAGKLMRERFDPASVNPDRNILEEAGVLVAVAALVLSISTIVSGVRAYRAGERSWIMWMGIVPAVLVCAFWLFMIIGEFLYPH